MVKLLGSRCFSKKTGRIISEQVAELIRIRREANNSVKHHGDLASLESVINACAAAWFMVLERARETKIFIGQSEILQMFKIFDCYDLIDSRNCGYGYAICRPMFNEVCYPTVRGQSEIEEAKEAYEERYLKGKKKQEIKKINS